jgi:ankyrin repeat protein
MSGLEGLLEDAAKTGDLAGVMRLAAAGASIHPAGGHNPLKWAACFNHVEVARWLLDAGVPADSADADGYTALMAAAYRNSMESARLLLERGASPRAVDGNNRSPVSIAREAGHGAMVELLNAPPPPAPPPPPRPDEVVFSYPLQNRVLQEIFNFPRRERISLVRTSETGPVEAMMREAFSTLVDQEPLRKAFAVHRERGGTVEEEEIFSCALVKAKMPRLPETGT